MYDKTIRLLKQPSTHAALGSILGLFGIADVSDVQWVTIAQDICLGLSGILLVIGVFMNEKGSAPCHVLPIIGLLALLATSGCTQLAQDRIEAATGLTREERCAGYAQDIVTLELLEYATAADIADLERLKRVHEVYCWDIE